MLNFGKFRSSKDKKDDEDKKQETVEDEILGLRLKEQTLLEKLNLVRKELEGKKEQVDKLEVVEGLFARSGFKLCVKTDTGDGYDKVRYYDSNVHVYIDDEDGNIISAETVQAVDFGRFVHTIYEVKDVFEKLLTLDFMKINNVKIARSTKEDFIGCLEYSVEVETDYYIWMGCCTVKLFGDGTFDIRSYVYRDIRIKKRDVLASGVVRDEETTGLGTYTIYFTLNKENIVSEDIVEELTTVYAKLKDAVLSDTVRLSQ
jgi:hypothetical protein